MAFSISTMPQAGAANAASAGTSLAAGQTVSAAWNRDVKQQVYDPHAVTGDYLKGRLVVEAGSFTLDIVDGRGRHVRRLADKASGIQEFQFVAGSEAEQLRVTSSDDVGQYRIIIERRLPAALQMAPEQSYLSPLIAEIADRGKSGETTDAFWAMVAEHGTPLVEPGPGTDRIVTFLGRGAKRNIRLLGAPTGDHEELSQLSGTDIWFKSFQVPATTRLSYQLAYDVPDLPLSARERRIAILATIKADPFNRHPLEPDAVDAYNQNSLLELPDAPPQPWLREHGSPKGTVTRFAMASAGLGNSRTVTIYRPAGFDPAAGDNILLFVFDGDEYQSKVPLPTILDNMIAARAISPVVAVFVSNPDRDARARELPANDRFADFMADELMPRIRAETGIRATAARTVLAGSSYGGLAAATVALRYPDLFGNVLSMSGSFWWSPPGTPADKTEYVAGEIALKPSVPLRFFLSAGLFETASRGTQGIVETNRHLRDVLQARNLPVVYREYAGAHDYAVWRGAISDGLSALFPTGEN